LEIVNLLQLYQKHPQLNAGKLVLAETDGSLFLEGLVGSTVSLSLSALFQGSGNDLILVQEDAETSGYLYHDMVQLLGAARVFFYPASFKRSLKYGRNDPGNTILRTETQSALHQGKGIVVVTYPDALFEKVVAVNELNEKTLDLHTGEQIDNAFVIELLQTFGFERVDYVYEPGQYSIRGSLIDVYSWSHELPYRIDFFGDEVESIRTFSIENQLSIDKIEAIHIIPFTNDDQTLLVPFTNYLNIRLFFAFQTMSLLVQNSINWQMRQ